MKYVYSLIFLILLMLAFLAHLSTGFSVIPGWHTTIYPMNYLVETSIKMLSLLFAVIGYVIIYNKFGKVDFRPFLFHFLLTIPAILFSLYSIDIEPSSSINDIEQQIHQTYLIGRLVFWGFVMGQIIFLVYFFRKMKLINL